MLKFQEMLTKRAELLLSLANSKEGTLSIAEQSYHRELRSLSAQLDGYMHHKAEELRLQSARLTDESTQSPLRRHTATGSSSSPLPSLYVDQLKSIYPVLKVCVVFCCCFFLRSYSPVCLLFCMCVCVCVCVCVAVCWLSVG
jgi:hypothetical protein